MDRKQFVISSSASAFAALAWLRGAGGLKALAANASAGLNAQTVALRVVQTILPFEDPRFPKIDSAMVRSRMYAIFSLGEDTSFASSLTLFDSIGAWSNPPKPIVELETAQYGPPDWAHDVNLLKHWSSTIDTNRSSFTDLNLRDGRSYLALWAKSAFGVRRRIYQSFKALVNSTAYSMDALWEVIGYDGPLVSSKGSS